MTTCKQPQPQSTPPAPLAEESTPPAPLSKGGGSISKTFIDQEGLTLAPSPSRGGLGRGYLYLLQKSIPAKGSGFTIVECLLAIILVGILMTAIAPVIVLSVATRVQARRVEQATAAARTYIDGLQTGAIKDPPKSIVPLAEAVVDPSNANRTIFSSARDLFATSVPAPPPTPITTCGGTITTNPAFPYCINDYNSNLSLYCVDKGGGCAPGNSKDFIVQAYRSVKSTTSGVPDLDPNTGLPTDDGSKGYLLGVRVYRADSFDGGSIPLTTTAVNGEKRAATNAGGKGDQRSPIVEMTTEIRTPGTDYQSLCERLGGCNPPSTNPSPSPSPT